MALEDRIAAFLDDAEQRTRAFRWAWWISLAFLLFGYGYIAWTLFY